MGYFSRETVVLYRLGGQTGEGGKRVREQAGEGGKRGRGADGGGEGREIWQDNLVYQVYKFSIADVSSVRS